MAGKGAVRISVGPCASVEVYDQLFDALVKAYTKLLKIGSY